MKRETTSKRKNTCILFIGKENNDRYSWRDYQSSKTENKYYWKGAKDINLLLQRRHKWPTHTAVVNAIFSDSECNSICCIYLNKLARKRLKPCLALSRKQKNKWAK